MSILPLQIPPLVHWRRHCKNGLTPDAQFYGDIVGGLNHCTAYRRKPIYRRTCKLGEAGGTSGTAWRWYCRSGYGARRFVVLAMLGLDDRVVAADPYIDVTITKVGGSATTVSFHGGASHVASVDAPEQWLVQQQFVNVDENSYYTGEVTFNDNVRVISLSVYEDTTATVDEAVSYFSTWVPSAASPIFDNRISRQLAGLGAMHRKNGALRADWCHVNGTARTRTSATPINLIDNSTTGTPSSSSPGWTFNTSYRNTYGASTVPILAAVYGSVAGGGTGTFKLRDTGGSDAASVTINSGSAGWFTAAGTMTVGSTVKLDPMFYSDGVNAATINAVSIFEEG